MNIAGMTGSRLSYVVVKLEGTVKRETCSFKRGKGIVQKLAEQPAGYMVYFPRGHALRFRDEAALAAYGLDRKPTIINLRGLEDPNSPVGKLISAQDNEARKGAMVNLERQVMQLATARSGPVLMPEQVVQVDDDSV